MPKLTVNGKEIEVPGGIRLSEALGHEHALAQPCAGLGRCGKCRVKVTGEVSLPCEQEKKLLSVQELAEGTRWPAAHLCWAIAPFGWKNRGRWRFVWKETGR